MKTCSIEGCKKQSRAKGYCTMHYQKFKKYGDPLASKKEKNCKIEGCYRKYFAKGYCQIHYNRWYKYSDPLICKCEFHGKTKTPEHRRWTSMKDRCCNPNNPNYKYYGARGITVCEHWRNSFLSFIEDMGPKPFPNAYIDRIDNDGNYGPANCRWATCKISNRNKSNIKLSEIKAKEIRKKYATGKYFQRELGGIYNVDPSTISYVITKKQWN